ncbi:MAG: V-type ATP synthase subunit F [Eubacteriales bacterium]|nr:V-type ATP synthase subunit F [Eubacteriales bacterium]
MYKVAAIGDKDSILAFRAVGIEVFTAYDHQAARSLVDRLAKEKYGLIFITEPIAHLIPETIRRYKSALLPAIILIPSNRGTLGIGMADINANVEKAVGSNIFANN